MIKIGGQTGTNGVLTKTAAMKIFTDLEAAGGLLEAVDLRLYTVGPTPNTSMVWTDFTEVVGSWYAAIAGLTWESTSFGAGVAEAVSIDPAAIFNYTGVSATQTVKGFALTTTDGGVTTVHYAEDLPETKIMAQVGDQLIVVPTLQIAAAV